MQTMMVPTSKSTLSYTSKINSITLPYVKQTIILHIVAVSFTSICVLWNLCWDNTTISYVTNKPFFCFFLNCSPKYFLAFAILFKKRIWKIFLKNKLNLFCIQAKRKLKIVWILILHDPQKKNYFSGYKFILKWWIKRKRPKITEICSIVNGLFFSIWWMVLVFPFFYEKEGEKKIDLWCLSET